MPVLNKAAIGRLNKSPLTVNSFVNCHSLSHYSGDDMLVRVIDGDPPIQNLAHFICVLRMAGGKKNLSKSDHDFNLEIRGSHVRIDARASLRAKRRTE